MIGERNENKTVGFLYIQGKGYRHRVGMLIQILDFDRFLHMLKPSFVPLNTVKQILN